MDVSAAQVPENNCMLTPAVLSEVPMLLMDIVGKADGATKEYHTSAPVVPQVLAIAGEEAVAPSSVPAVLEQDVPVESEVAAAHSLLAGGGGGSSIHIV